MICRADANKGDWFEVWEVLPGLFAFTYPGKNWRLAMDLALDWARMHRDDMEIGHVAVLGDER